VITKTSERGGVMCDGVVINRNDRVIKPSRVVVARVCLSFVFAPRSLYLSEDLLFFGADSRASFSLLSLAAARMPCEPLSPPGGGGGLSARRFGVLPLFLDGVVGRASLLARAGVLAAP